MATTWIHPGIHRTHRLDLPPAGTRLLARLEARDLAAHAHRVARSAAWLCGAMALEEDATRLVVRAALFHDVGKLAIPQAVLDRPGPLRMSDWRLVRRHPADGERIVAGLPGLEDLAPLVRAHDERWDGRGYPDRLAGGDIPIGARIIFVCDAFDAMTGDRCYRAALSAADAVRELLHGAGHQFDPVAAAILAARMSPEPGYARPVTAPQT